MKKYLFLGLVLFAQVLWLSVSSYQRSQEIAHSPIIRLVCKTVDPRDFLRGDYIVLDIEERVASSKVRLGSVASYELFSGAGDTLAVFSQGEKGLGVLEYLIKKADFKGVEKEGQYAMPVYSCSIGYVPEGMSIEEPRGREERRAYREKIREDEGKKEAYFDIRVLPWSARRFYVPEGTGEFMSIWNEFYKGFPVENNVELTADLVVRGLDKVPLFKQVYVNGIPYPEAIALIRARQWGLKTPEVKQQEQKEPLASELPEIESPSVEEEGHGSEEEME